MRKNVDLSLYLVTDRDLSLGRSLEEVVSEAVAGGVTVVQLREKDASTGEFVELARRMMDMLNPLGVPLIINDRVDVALAVDADGVHIGQSDMKYEDARRLLGPDKIIGLSVESFEDIEAANALDVDYVGISPVYGTPTKTDTAEPFGLEGLRKAVAMSEHPTVAIGGMNAKTIGEVIAAGADGVAVVSAICSAEDVKEATTELKSIVDANAKKSWSSEVWKKSLSIYNDILELDFLKELADGSLSDEAFGRYIAQDEIYLKNYYHQMKMLADLMEDEQDKELFLAFAQSGMEGEKAMHDMLIEKYGIETEVQPSKVTTDYNTHICEGISTGNPCIALAAVLPCMWIYNRVGLHILEHSKLEGNPYKEWILEYGNEEFTIGVNQVLEMLDNWASKADEQTLKAMDYYYLKAALYEYAFWDYGYNADTKSYDYID
ncbi:MAG: thiamine phosphate synthase [Bacteroidales bacterium]|nr:thiamine phosphate synthase [Bacteroidales bacterium]MBQ5582117.1 thiamine phosphate synthase [Bacteroidales bacterium]